MSDDADELILKMQHLQAQAKAQAEARRQDGAASRMKSAAQKLAWKAQGEVAAAEAQRDEAEKVMEALRADGLDRTEAPEYVAAQDKAREAERLLVRARAQLNFALDRLSEAERREYEATVAEARAEFHGQMAEDPLFKKE